MAAAKKRTSSEIDDIFAANSTKATAKSNTLTNSAASSSTSAQSSSASAAASDALPDKKKKKKTIAITVADKERPAGEKHSASTAAPPKRVPETIVDTSRAIETYKPEPLVAKPLRDDATEAERKAAEEDERFMDSRGTRKKTEDGLPIYSLDELNIGHGGDTPECPFDCQCCF